MKQATLRTHTLERLAAWDRGLCRRFNSVSHFALLRVLLITASRLGNGAFWYLLMAAILVSGADRAVTAVLHMIAVGLACTAVYKLLKHRLARARPHTAQPGIMLCVAPLDRYSFPSGHTLHAVAFTLTALAYYPGLFWLVVPFSVLVALSRVVLGLHYPTDVIAGACIGAALAWLSNIFV